MSNKHSTYTENHQRRRTNYSKVPSAELERRFCPEITRMDNTLSSAEKAIVSENTGEILKELRPPSTETESDAAERWLENPPQIFVIEVNRQTGKFLGLKKIEEESESWEGFFHDKEAPLIGLHLTVVHDAYLGGEETILGYEPIIDPPIEPGNDKFIGWDYCVQKDWISPRAAVVIEHTAARLQEQLRPLPPQT